MKNFKILLASTLVVLVSASCAFAGDCAKKDCAKSKPTDKMEAYAHPTMFGSQAQQTNTAKETYIVGGKVYKHKNHFGVANKDNVIVSSRVDALMNLLEKKQKAARFDSKMPVLRSELAVILAEEFGLNNKSASNKYKDIPSDYWAKDWIYGALNSGVMIGYPDNKFRPDQPVTKAEVFATVAQLISVPTDRSLIVPEFNGKQMQNIPKWAIAPTKEVVASDLLKDVPNPGKVNSDEYLSKEQVAYLICSLKQNWTGKNSIAKDQNAPDAIKNYAPVVMNVKILDRLSARHSNAGDRFTAETTSDVTINGQCFKAGSKVRGEVVQVVRPGIKNPGYIKVKFVKIQDGDLCAEFPKNLSQAQVDTLKNPNIIARLFGFPFSAAGRIVGIVGRTAGSGVDVVGNSLEEFGDELSNTFVDTLTLHPGSGAINLGKSVATLGIGVYDIGKLLVSGTFGVLYEFTDEVRYLIVPKYSNESSLNPNEELKIVF